MFLAANPERAKSESEKEEIAKKYKPGDSIFPVKQDSSESESEDDDEEDRRVIEEVRQLSLEESGSGRGSRAGRRVRQSSGTHHAEGSDTDGRASVDGRSRRRRREEEREMRRHTEHRVLRTAGHVRGASDSAVRPRRVEHQSSLRSLLSLSDTEAMEEEILRQILEGGLLDGIDLDNLTPAQEEALSDRIADAYRELYRTRSRSQRADADADDDGRSRQLSREPARQNPRASSQSIQRPGTAPAPRESSRNPHMSRSHLLEIPSTRSSHHRRLSDQGSRRRITSPLRAHYASSSEVILRPAARSSSNMIPDRLRPRARAGTGDFATRSRRATESEQTISRPATSSSMSATTPLVSSRPRASTLTRLTPLVPGSNALVNYRPSSSQTPRTPTPLYAEPSMLCERCGKIDIQYEVYKNCSKCKDGNYNVCLRCYRLGRGCLKWFGTGVSAWVEYEKHCASPSGQSSSTLEPPHILLSFRYRPPPETARRTVNEGKQMTSSNPASRLQTGLFCDMCHSSANDCFWRCTQCNQGDWGFCARCVNQGKCCTHALLPVCRMTSTSDLCSSSPLLSTTPPQHISTDNATYKTLSISTKCDICAYPIPASLSRFHCLQCNDGDYDICPNCYLKLVASGKIAKENGHNGWRRCLRGHRMVVIGFEAHEDGQKRVIVRGLVGGHALKDEYQQQQQSIPTPTLATSTTANTLTLSPEHGSGDWSWKEGSERRKKASRIRSAWVSPNSTPNPDSNNANNNNNDASFDPTSPTSPIIHSHPRRFPPDGGVGLIVHARWSWFPEDDVKDELMFPRGAEITEAENINDDWFWGCYAGVTGLFPGGHVSVVGEVV